MYKAIEIYSHILKEYLSQCFENQQNINPVALNKERFKVKAVFTASMVFLKNNPIQEGCKIVSATNNWLQNSFAEENLFSSIIESASDELVNLVDNN